jgi:glycine/D-amino acid oxidase-like deaminating enzyme
MQLVRSSVNQPIWEDGQWTPLAPLAGDVTADVCVIGLGGSGLMAVQELVDAGATVVGVDAKAIGAGAAGRNAGFLLAGLADFFPTTAARFGEATAVDLYRETLGEIDRLRRQAPRLVSITGVLRLAADDAELHDCEEQVRALQRHGFPAETYAGPEGRGVLVPSDGIFQPLQFAREQAKTLISRGARLHEQTPVTTLTASRVTTATGVVSCATIVVAVDGGLERLLPELQPRVRTARLQMLATAPAGSISFPRPIYWRDGFEYWQQLPDGVVALGGFRDAGGPGEWTHDATPSTSVQEKLERFLREHLRVTAPITHRWAASVSYTGDGLPVLEQVRRGVFATGAYSGTGNTVGRLGGRAAAQLALGRTSTWAKALRAAREHAAR